VRFADTNILLYAVSRNADEETKRHTAEAILRQGDIGLSVQVLQEFLRAGHPGHESSAQRPP
jgi:predicted nucleic acid-binding protein